MRAPGSDVDIEHVVLPIDGLACGGGGALTVEREIERLEGVRRVYVNAATEMAYVEFDTTRIDRSALVEAIENAGFGVGAVGRRGIP